MIRLEPASSILSSRVNVLAGQVLFEITAAGSTLIVLRYLDHGAPRGHDVHRIYKMDILRFYVLSKLMLGSSLSLICARRICRFPML